jgi:GGDEF domain-containing protein
MRHTQIMIFDFYCIMDFKAFVEKYGERTTKAALTLAVGRIRGIIREKVGRAASTDGILVLSVEELRLDVASVAHVLSEFPFSAEEKYVLLAKAWEIVTP